MTTRVATSSSASSAQRDRILLMGARSARGFGAGALSIVIALDLTGVGYSSFVIGLLLGLALGGAAAWALAVPRIELHWRRRSVFLLSAAALAVGGILLWVDIANPALLLAALLLGGIVAGGADVSPLGALEQAALAGTTADRVRTQNYAVYNLLGYVGVALGALAAGPLYALGGPTVAGFPPGPHDATLLFYGLLGLALVPLYRSLSSEIDLPVNGKRPSPLSPSSRPIVYSLSALFSVDAFAGGLIVNSLVVYYFSTEFRPGVDLLGFVFFLSNLAAGVSLILAAPLARRFGLVNTMVFSHIPSNVFLILVVFAPSFLFASFLWVARATLSQMDVPTRQSYMQAVVPAEDRAAAAGYTTAARSCQAFGAPVTGSFLA
ncbi:MAG: MFS transporter, partial [Thermoplasmata archaeon]